MIIGGLVTASCFSIAAGMYTLRRGQLPPMFFDGQGGFRRPHVAPSAVRRWGIGLLAFGVALAALTMAGFFIPVNGGGDR